MRKKILIISNVTSGLYKFRREVIAKIAKSYNVAISAANDSCKDELENMGCIFYETALNRHGINPLEELKLLRYYWKLLCEEKPNVVLTYTIKPNIYGGIACAALGIPYIANITGLGTAVENGGVMQKITVPLYRLGLRKAHKVFFQNAKNCAFMLQHKMLSGAYDTLPGSGVNLKQHTCESYPAESTELLFLTVGRIMRDKGVYELLEAARIVRQTYPNARFRMVGSFDEACENAVMKAVEEGAIEFLGPQRDVHPFYAESHAIIHPSYHEGMSNVLLEAAATGRPVLASNIPGCRETFDEGVSGIGFEPRNVDDLVRAIEQFIALPYEKKAAMGRAGREKMEREFDRQIVVDAYMKEIHEIEESKHAAL